MTPIRSLTVGVDGSAAATSALSWAVGLARWTQASVQAVCTWQYPYFVSSPGLAMPDLIVAMPDPAEMRKQADVSLQETIEAVTLPFAIETRSIQGESALVLEHESETADLLVVGRPQHHGRWLVGSTTLHSVRHSSCPVAVVPPGFAWPENPRVAVAIDGSHGSIEALAWAIGLVGERGTAVAVHAHDEAMLDDLDLDDDFRLELNRRAALRLDEIVGDTAQQLGVDPKRIEQTVVSGDPRSTVLEAEPDADLFVVGAHGHLGVSAFYVGSFADYAVRHAAIPLVVVRKPVAADE